MSGYATCRISSMHAGEVACEATAAQPQDEQAAKASRNFDEPPKGTELSDDFAPSEEEKTRDCTAQRSRVTRAAAQHGHEYL